ncbi:MAG: hypothetical protein QOH35_50 [Acidobacteriaceae bacterium]|jgi:hypothetical protein|nr:hypothetical protein [Acidobacteriaceae bacterium]MDX6459339.1 hypothetical protein [Acidobacteriaceae bacterium]MEA2263756.1 hypothetical protein [Acidobacteriaceae bacterium]MEA2538684.1 hypothetical protein [Acidobacteriaceae bacterium]
MRDLSELKVTTIVLGDRKHHVGWPNSPGWRSRRVTVLRAYNFDVAITFSLSIVLLSISKLRGMIPRTPYENDAANDYL